VQWSPDGRGASWRDTASISTLSNSALSSSAVDSARLAGEGREAGSESQGREPREGRAESMREVTGGACQAGRQQGRRPRSLLPGEMRLRVTQQPWVCQARPQAQASGAVR